MDHCAARRRRRRDMMATACLMGCLAGAPARSQLDVDRVEPWDQLFGIEDTPEDNDLFGSPLATGDLDCDGFSDLIVGVPFEDLEDESGADIVTAGAFHVIYGSAEGLSISDDQFIVESDLPGGLSEANAVFPGTFAVGRFDGDACDDLAVGHPRDAEFAGIVWVLYGDELGVDPAAAQTWQPEMPGLENVPDGEFGAALVAGDFDGDGFDDLAIGIPGASDSFVISGGAVAALRGGPAGLEPVAGPSWTLLLDQDVGGVTGMLDTVESLDRFGSGLAACDFDDDGPEDLAIAVMGEDGRGALQVVYGGPAGLDPTDNWIRISTEDRNWGTYGAAMATGDLRSTIDGCELLLGIPQRDVMDGGLRLDFAGAAELWLIDDQPVETLTLEQSMLPGQHSAANEMFGGALAIADLWGDGTGDLLVTAYGEDSFTGGLHLLPTTSSTLPLSLATTWRQDTWPEGDEAEPSDAFGYDLTVGDFDGDGAPDVAVAATTETDFRSRQGMVQVGYGTPPIFRDGFESGDLGVWAVAVP